MERETPTTASEEIELYLRTYYSLLRSSGEVLIRSLEETHAAMGSSLHPYADSSQIDVSAFVYSCMRLPPCISRTRLIVLGQSEEVFAHRGGYYGVEKWQPARAAARRRKMFFDGNDTLAAFIASVSDIDDLIPMLTAYQIEWNKIHQKLSRSSAEALLAAKDEQEALAPEEAAATMAALGLSTEDFGKIEKAWGDSLRANLLLAARHEKNFAIRLLAGSLTDYRRATQGWWDHIENELADIGLSERTVYFVSSNTHSITNLLSGFALNNEELLLNVLRRSNPEDLRAEWEEIEKTGNVGERNNLLYYLLRYQNQYENLSDLLRARERHFADLGIHLVETPEYLDVAVQVIEINRLDPDMFDSRIQLPGQEALPSSEALIVNVDYPLGMAAYHVFSQISANVGRIKGVYVMGKAATLNGRIGDVMIPNVVYDEHSRNTFLFKNCFAAGDVGPYLTRGTVFDNQKAVTVRGTFQQNNRFMTLFYREGYTDIEMEAGPYLSALYENIYPKRFPIDEIVNLFINTPYDIGFLHYASDTPYSRRQTLLSKSMSYFGMDSTYACSVAILRHLLHKEIQQRKSGR